MVEVPDSAASWESATLIAAFQGEAVVFREDSLLGWFIGQPKDEPDHASVLRDSQRQ